MKNVTKKILKTMAVFAMLLTVVAVNKDVAKASTLIDSNNVSADAIVPGVVTTGTKDDISNKTSAYLLSSDGTNPVKLTVTKNGILDWFVASQNPSANLTIYKDEACTESVTSITTTDTQTEYGYLSEEKAVYLTKGTYYVKQAYGDAGEFLVYSCLFNAEDRAVSNKAWSAAGTQDYNKPVYFKVKAGNTAKILVAFDETFGSSSYNVTLCNSKKKAISDTSYIAPNDKAVYAVAKGTYYIKVTTNNDVFRIRPTLSTAADKTGATKAKARKMTRNGAKIGGVVTATDKTSKVDWIKIVNSKTQANYLYIDAEITSGTIQAEIIGLNGKSMGTLNLSEYSPSAGGKMYTIGSGYSGNTLAKGTYYVKIKKKTAKTSGTYKVYLKSKAIN